MNAPAIKVFSYRRFSSGRQAHGHSLERQIASARRWCLEQGHTLDESLALSDLGVSAFKGDNASRGALAAFLDAIEQKKIPAGSILLVESLDRLSRAALPEAVGLLTQIVSHGIRVVSLIDGKEWNQKTIQDTMNFMLSVLLFSRAHEESSTKSRRVSESFQSKRKAGLPVVSVMHGGGWLKPLPDKSGWEVIADRAESVRKVFEFAAAGKGGTAIARTANEEGWPMPFRRTVKTKAWEHTGISRLLRDRRVIGEWQPRRVVSGKLTPDGDPVKNYFPSVIPDELWHRTQTALRGRPGPQRIRGVFSDVFAGVIYCGYCKSGLEKKAPSGRGRARYYCKGRKAGLCDAASIDEKSLVQVVFKALAQIDERSFRDETAVAEIVKRIQVAEAKVSDAKERAKRIVAAIEEGSSIQLLTQRLTSIEQEEQSAHEELENLRTQLSAVPLIGGGFPRDFSEKVLKWIEDKTCTEERHKISSSLHRILDRVNVFADEDAIMLTFRDGYTIGVPIAKRFLTRNPSPELRAHYAEIWKSVPETK